MSAVFAQIVRRRMRASGVTIKALAQSMGVTQTRVREVRNHGTPPKGNAMCRSWMQDWLIAIRNAHEKGRQS